VTLSPWSQPLPLSGDDLPDEAVTAILALLNERFRFDVHNYKDRCIRRRIAKRLRASGCSDVDSYLARLLGDVHEQDLLLETLSIHVSRFFRDVEVFRVLERRVLPELCTRLRNAGRAELKLWSAGCAEGEEAYSLALLAGERPPSGLTVSILATDVSAAVLAKGREGYYAPGHLSEVPEALRSTCFTAESGHYRLQARFRERVEFRCHDLTAAADYPSADLILCRNVLIYFSEAEQERIVTRFAAALPVGGILVLGRTEALPRRAHPLFHAEFPAERIFRRLAEG